MIPKVNVGFSFKKAIISFNLLLKKSYSDNSSCFDTYYLNHARTGLRIALSALGLPIGSKIGVAAYNCYTVMNAIIEAGYEIVFIDIDDNFHMDLNDLQYKKAKIDALIVTHFFGLPENIKAITDICNDIPIIEDCAHSFMSSSTLYETGTVGDFAVFSVGLGKFPSIGDGGILKINNVNYIDTAQKEIKKLRQYSKSEEIRLILKHIFMNAVYSPFIYRYTRALYKRKQTTTNFIYKHDERQMSFVIRNLYEIEYSKFLIYKNIQQNKAKALEDAIKNNKLFSYPNIDFEKNNCFMFPVLCRGNKSLTNHFKKYDIEVTSHFSKSIEWAIRFGYSIGDCKNVERLVKHIYVFPIHYRLKDKHIRRMIEGIKTYTE